MFKDESRKIITLNSRLLTFELYFYSNHYYFSSFFFSTVNVEQHATADRQAAAPAPANCGATYSKSDHQIEFPTITVSLIMRPIYIYSCLCFIHKLLLSSSLSQPLFSSSSSLSPAHDVRVCAPLVLPLTLPPHLLPSAHLLPAISSGRLLIMYD